MMTVGPVSAWLVWGVLALAGCGLWAACWTAAAGLSRLWERSRRDRVTPLTENEGMMCRPCEEHRHAECERYRDLPGPSWCICRSSKHDDRLLGLPPERTWEQMTSHQLPVGLPEAYEAIRGDMVPGPLERELWHDVERERRAPWWEAEHRAAYESLGLDYPSGLLAAIRSRP